MRRFGHSEDRNERDRSLSDHVVGWRDRRAGLGNQPCCDKRRKASKNCKRRDVGDYPYFELGSHIRSKNWVIAKECDERLVAAPLDRPVMAVAARL
jgi:hypothetical protein